MSIYELYQNSQKINLSELRDEVLMSIDYVIIDTITEEQLQLGIDANNQSLPNYVQGNYKEYKNQKNPKSAGQNKKSGERCLRSGIQKSNLL